MFVVKVQILHFSCSDVASLISVTQFCLAPFIAKKAKKKEHSNAGLRRYTREIPFSFSAVAWKKDI